MTVIDTLDKHILSEIQTDDQTSNVELAERVGLSPAGVHKRLKKLRENGYVEKSVALLSRKKLGLDLLFFLHIRFKENMKPENTEQLGRALHTLPEVLECYTLTGTDDALLKVVVPDQASLKNFMQRLSESQNVIEKAHTAIVLEELKATTCLPLGLEEGLPKVG